MGTDQDYACELVGSDELDSLHITVRVLDDHHTVFPECEPGPWELYFLWQGEYYFTNQLL
jgi:hypothetical protein